MSTSRKRVLISQACSFCKERHLKCDGSNPCFQCRQREQTCSYLPSVKRGRKPKNATGNSEQLTTKNQNKELIPANKKTKTTNPSSESNSEMSAVVNEVEFWKEKYFQVVNSSFLFDLPLQDSFQQEFSPLMTIPDPLFENIGDGVSNETLFLLGGNEDPSSPSFSMETFFSAFEIHVKTVCPSYEVRVSSQFPWHMWSNLQISNRSQMDFYNVGGLIDAFEFAVICALGSQIFGNLARAQTEVFIEKADTFFHILFFVEKAQSNPDWIERLVSSLILYALYFAGQRDVEKAQLCSGIAYNSVSFNSSRVSNAVQRRLYAFLCAGARTANEKLNWIQKYDTVMDDDVLVEDILCFLIYTLAISLGMPSTEVQELYFKLLDYTEETERKAVSPNRQLVRPRKETLRDIFGCKAILFSRLGYGPQAQFYSIQCLKLHRELGVVNISRSLGVPFVLMFSLMVCKNTSLCDYARDSIIEFFPIYASAKHTYEHIFGGVPFCPSDQSQTCNSNKSIEYISS